MVPVTTAAEVASANESKADRKARLKEEKASAKTAKAEMKAQEKADKANAKEQGKAEKADAKAAGKDGKKADKKAITDDSVNAKWERYNQLRANVHRRRVAYVVAIILGIAVFLATAWDITFNASEFQWYLLPLFAAIILWEIILLFSRRRHLQEVRELEAMQRTYLECENCNSVFQFGELRLKRRQRVGFSCPVCSEDSALPAPDAIPVERVLPEANVVENSYACGNCQEQIVVGTFGARPRESRFQACPSCGLAGQISMA